MPRVGASHLSFALCAAVLAWGALPYVQVQIDDAYIVFAYAHRLVERGEVAWNTGVRVEGYSSVFHLLLMAAGAGVGLDLAIFARVVSFACALGVLGLLLRRQMGPGRLLVALAVAAWQPFQFWATMGMETALATLIAVAAWPLVLGTRAQWAGGTLLCVLLSLTRPEAAAWLGLALLRRVALARTAPGRSVGRPEIAVAVGCALLAGYHGLRIAYFGDVMPTPFLVKLAAEQRWWIGQSELVREGLTAAGIVTLLWALRAHVDRWALLPVAIQGALLIKAGGDWMGNGRFLLPGMLATVAAVLAHGAPRVATRPVLAGAALLAVGGLLWEPAPMGGREPGLRDTAYLRNPVAALRASWPTPMLEETSFLVERLPKDAGASISDVGLPGNLDDIRIWDATGLTDRVVAEMMAEGSQAEMRPELRARYEDDDDVWCLRYDWQAAEIDSADEWLRARLPELSPSRAAVANFYWRCRPDAGPSAALVTERWHHLLERYPSQDWIRWYYARSLLATDRAAEALAVASDARWLDRGGAGWIAFGTGQDGSYHLGRGWAHYGNGVRLSAAAPAAFWQRYRLSVDVDDPGAEGARIRVGWADGCAPAEERTLFERTTVPLPGCDTPGPRRLSVELLNDASYEGFDRNIYVSLVEAG